MWCAILALALCPKKEYFKIMKFLQEIRIMKFNPCLDFFVIVFDTSHNAVNENDLDISDQRSCGLCLSLSETENHRRQQGQNLALSLSEGNFSHE